MSDDGKVQYATYTVEELGEALAGIDRARFPLNFANLQREIALRGHASTPGRHAVAERVATDPSPGPLPKPASVSTMAGALILCLLMLGLALVGLARGDVFLPHRGGGTHLHGRDAIVLVVFLVLAVVANGTRLASAMKYSRRDAGLYRFGEVLSWISLAGIGVYALLRMA